MKTTKNPKPETPNLTAAELRRRHNLKQFEWDIRNLSAAALRRRIRTQREWLCLFNECLDGFPQIQNIPGGGMDNCRAPDDIRRVVEALLEFCPVTWENGFRPQPRSYTRKPCA